MLNKIIEFSIRNKLVVGLFVIALIAYGSIELTRLPIDAVPDITNNQVQVITVAPALGATDIERLVTFPLEQANRNLPGLVEIRSFSRFGLSLVTIVFNDDVDIYWARQQVTERIQRVQAELPAGTGRVELGPVSTGLGEIYQYVVRAKPGYENKYSVTDLRSIQDWIVRRQLLGVKGVAEVSSFGGRMKQYEVAIVPSRLNAYGLTAADVFRALEGNNQNTGGAYLEKGSAVLSIRSEGLLTSLDEIRAIRIKTLPRGEPLRIGDVAEVRYGSAARYGALTYNEAGEVSGAVVLMLKGENSSAVIKRVKARVEEIKSMLPDGVVIEPFLDRTKMVDNAIHTVETNLLEGALIVVFVLVLFLGSFRAGLIVASVIPLSMLFAVILMNLFGVSGSLMSLGALDFGLIVDGAVIIVEAVLHHLIERRHTNGVLRIARADLDETVKFSAGRMMNSAVFGQIIILVVYLPIFTLQGIEGKMFKPMAQTVIFALLGAFLLSLTYVPMVSSLLLGKLTPAGGFSDRMMLRFERGHQALLRRAARFPKTIMAVVVILFFGSVFVLLRLGGEFIPSLEEGDFAVELRTLNGSNLETTIRSAENASRILRERFPEVERVVTKIGTSEVPTDPMPMNAGDMIVNLKPKAEWTSAGNFPELAEKMSQALAEVPGITAGFQYPVQMRFNELMTGAKQDVVCKIFGENLDSLAAYADRLGSIAASVKGARDIYVEPVTGLPQVVISYDRAAMAQYGLDIAEVNRVVNMALAGQSAGFVYEGERRFDLVVRLIDKERQKLEDVANLLVSTPGGLQVPLYQLARVELVESPGQIQREDTRRRIVVGFNVRDRDVETVVNELRQKVERDLHFANDYNITYGGAFENLNAAKKRLGIAVPVSLLLIFLLLYFSFRSIRQGLLIYSAIPLSAMGGIFALALRGMPFSISAGVGFIALFGVAVLNGIVLIAEFNRLRATGLSNLTELVFTGTRNRLRPVLMTAFVASLGFLPMALSNGAGAEVQRPLATVVIGGLLIATFLTLFVLPLLYVLVERRATNRHNKKQIITALSLTGLIGMSLMTHGQTITLPAAIDTAIKNNLLLKNAALRAQYQEKLVHAGLDLPQTAVGMEYGQINSIYQDNRFSIGQSFSFPAVYTRQRSLLKGEWTLGVLAVAIQERELRRDVAMVYNNLLHLMRKRQLLQETDSLYADVLKRAQLRVEKGESSVVEQTAASLQRNQIRLQLLNLSQDVDLLRLQFQLLLNTAQPYSPDSLSGEITATLPADTSGLFMGHPQVQWLAQQREVATLSSRLQRSRGLPALSLSYNNMTMKGTGADDRTYGAGNRFQSAQVSLGLPLFFSAQRARVKAAQVGELLAENNYETGLMQLQGGYRAALADYRRYRTSLHYVEKVLLPGLPALAEVANRQLNSGNINYMEWVMLYNQVIAIRNEYLETQRLVNEAAIKLNYLQSK